jgi:nicotinate phosphoribosyltransferase
VALAPRLKAASITRQRVRLDSGDMIALSKSVRRILDEGNLADVTIFAGGGLDEDQLMTIAGADARSIASHRHKPHDLLRRAASIALTSSRNMPDCRAASMRPEKRPGQDASKFGGAIRLTAFAGDTLSVEDDDQRGEPLIHPVMQAGKRVASSPTLDDIRAHATRELRLLPAPLRELKPGTTYPVQVGQPLVDLTAQFDHRLKEQERKP